MLANRYPKDEPRGPMTPIQEENRDYQGLWISDTPCLESF